MNQPHHSLQGQLLLDGGKLRGSFFHRSVVLICHHDEEGAFGLVLNRSTRRNIGNFIFGDSPPALKEHTLYLGGPVKPNSLNYLHCEDAVPSKDIMSNLHVGNSIEKLVEISEDTSQNTKVRVFAGYAGWNPGQLDVELAANSWLVHPASIDLVFDPDSDNLWRCILETKDWYHRLLARSPEDLSWN